MRSAFVRALVEEAERDERIMLLTGDLGFMALEPFRDRFPDRFYNMGVAEQNMVGVATGLAEAGFIPFCYSIVPFAVFRPYEFIRDGPVLHGQQVRIVGMGGGFEYGNAGPTHYGLEDVGVMRLLQGMAVVAPADSTQATTAVGALADWPGPAYLRLGKNERHSVPGLDGRFELGHVQQTRTGTDVVIFAMGGISPAVAEAVDLLEASGISTSFAVIASIHPTPTDDLARLVGAHRLAVTVEAHTKVGGIGSLVAETIADTNTDCRLLRLGVENPYSGRGGSEAFLNEVHGLSATAVAARIRDVLVAEPTR